MKTYKNSYKYELYKKAILRHGNFKKGKGKINIIGIRAYKDGKALDKNTLNIFDDTIALVYKDEKGHKIVIEYLASVDPGRHYTENPYKKRGCAHLVNGQHKYRFGFHHNGRTEKKLGVPGWENAKYRCLVPFPAVDVYRDKNKNGRIDKGEKKKLFKLSDIHIHYGGEKETNIGYYSAGCQIICHEENYLNFIKTILKDTSISKGKDGYPVYYTLIDGAELVPELCFPQKKFSKQEAIRLYKDSENDTLNYYPITAYGWWHNGVHLSGKKNDDIRAIADGKIIYTKLSRNEGNYGSPNFILIKHELEIDDKKVVFYSLYMHLKKVLIKKKLIENDEIPDWIKRKFYGKVQQGKVKFFELKGRFIDKEKLFLGNLTYTAPVRVSAGEVIGYMGKGIEHLEVKEHSTTTTKKATLLHFEIFSRTKDNEGTDIYNYLKAKPYNYFTLEDKDDDVIAEPLKEKKSNLANLYKRDKEFANYLNNELPEAFATKEASGKIILKDGEVFKFMEKYKRKFRDAVAMHISTWQAIGNKVTYVTTCFNNKLWYEHSDELKKDLTIFHLFNNKILKENEKLYFYNPIRFIEILHKKLTPPPVKSSKKVSSASAASGKKLLVTKVDGPSYQWSGITAIYKATQFNKSDPSDTEKQNIKWLIKNEENGKVIQKFDTKGAVLKVKFPSSWAGKTIRVMPYINSPSSKVSVLTTIWKWPKLFGGA